MSIDNILFTPERNAINPDEINEKIVLFKYKDTTYRIIQDSKELDRKGEVFYKCASLILSNFGMTRSGRFKEFEKQKEILINCWTEVGELLSISEMGHF